MSIRRDTFKSFDGKELKLYQWQVENPRANVIIVHGMAEHAARYERLAKFLNQKSISVFAYDQRGHGHTAGSNEGLGYKEEGSFWDKVQKDLAVILKSVQGDIPTFLMGHSMGSFIVRDYVASNNPSIKGLILSGTQGNPGPLLAVGKIVASLIGWIKGRNLLSNTLNTMSFGKFNDAFKPVKTEFDWLSRDPEEVNNYINDPYCGHLVSVALWKCVLYGVGKVNQSRTFADTNKDLSIYLFAGDQDPVGGFGKGVEEVHDKFKNAGIKDLHIRLYKEGRHEMLNETNREEVMQDLLDWINTRL